MTYTARMFPRFISWAQINTQLPSLSLHMWRPGFNRIKQLSFSCTWVKNSQLPEDTLLRWYELTSPNFITFMLWLFSMHKPNEKNLQKLPPDSIEPFFLLFKKLHVKLFSPGKSYSFKVISFQLKWKKKSLTLHLGGKTK